MKRRGRSGQGIGRTGRSLGEFMVTSVRRYGILIPEITRRLEDGGAAGRTIKKNCVKLARILRGVRSDSIIAENSDDSARTVQRYIRLTELQQMVEENGRKSVSRATSDRTSPACPFCLEEE